MLMDSYLDPHYVHIYSPAQGNAEGRNCHLTQYEILNEVFLKSLHPELYVWDMKAGAAP